MSDLNTLRVDAYFFEKEGKNRRFFLVCVCSKISEFVTTRP